MRLIVLTHSFPPMRYPRAIQIERLLCHLDWPASVVCAQPDGYDPTDTPGPAPPKTGIMRVPRPFWDRFLARVLNRVAPELLRRPDRERFWSRCAARLLVQRFTPGAEDILVSFSSPVSDHLAGLRVHRRTGCRWIACFSDPWVNNPLNPLAGRTLALAKKWERSVFSRADRLVFTSKETAERVMAGYPRNWRDKCRVVEHAYAREVLEDHEPGARLLLRHLGNLYAERSAAPLLAALACIVRQQPALLETMRIELIGHCERSLESFSDYAALPSGLITSCDPVTYSQSLSAMREADLLLVLDAPADTSPFLPSKLVEYFGSGTPIAALTPPGTSARLVREAGGWVADPAEPAAMARMLVQALEGARDRKAWRIRSQAVRARFDPRRVAADFAAILNELSPGLTS